MKETKEVTDTKDTKQKEKYQFLPDSAIKKLLMELSTSRLLEIINELCHTNYPIDSIVDFGNTEHFTILGDLEKSNTRGDLTMTIQNKIKTERTNKVIVELQSTKDKSMGFRMFVYSLNEAKKENGNTYIFPKGATIYTTLDLPKEGVDEVHMQLERFRVGDIQYSAAKGDILTVEFPYINLLTMDYKEFQKSPLEPLKVIYPYRYRKQPNLLKEAEFPNIMEDVRTFTLKQKGNDRLVVSELVNRLMIDILEICKKNEDRYRKEREIMEAVYMTSTDVLIKESKELGELIGEARGKLEGKLEVAKNLLEDEMTIVKIAEITKLSVGQIEALQRKEE